MNGLTWPFADNDFPNHPFLLHPKLEVPNPGRIRLPNQEQEKATNHSEKHSKLPCKVTLWPVLVDFKFWGRCSRGPPQLIPVVKSSDDPGETSWNSQQVLRVASRFWYRQTPTCSAPPWKLMGWGMCHRAGMLMILNRNIYRNRYLLRCAFVSGTK